MLIQSLARKGFHLSYFSERPVHLLATTKNACPAPGRIAVHGERKVVENDCDCILDENSIATGGLSIIPSRAESRESRRKLRGARSYLPPSVAKRTRENQSNCSKNSKKQKHCAAEIKPESHAVQSNMHRTKRSALSTVAPL